MMREVARSPYCQEARGNFRGVCPSKSGGMNTFSVVREAVRLRKDGSSKKDGAPKTDNGHGSALCYRGGGRRGQSDSEQPGFAYFASLILL